VQTLVNTNYSITTRRSPPSNIFSRLQHRPRARCPAARPSHPRAQRPRRIHQLRRMVPQQTRCPRLRRRRLLRPPVGSDQPAQRRTCAPRRTQPRHPVDHFRPRPSCSLAMRLRSLEPELVASGRDDRLRPPKRLVRGLWRPRRVGRCIMRWRLMTMAMCDLLPVLLDKFYLFPFCSFFFIFIVLVCLACRSIPTGHEK
jgi:hypothetical protein